MTVKIWCAAIGGWNIHAHARIDFNVETGEKTGCGSFIGYAAVKSCSQFGKIALICARLCVYVFEVEEEMTVVTIVALHLIRTECGQAGAVFIIEASADFNEGFHITTID